MSVCLATGFRFGIAGSGEVNSAYGENNGLDSYGIKFRTFEGFGAVTAKLTRTSSTYIIGIKFKTVESSSTVNIPLVTIADAGGTHCSIAYNSVTGGIRVQNSAGTMIGTESSPTAVGNSGEWIYIEAKITIGNSPTGAAEVRYYGTSILALSSIDTQNGADTGEIWFTFGHSSQPRTYFDFAFVLDDQGGVNNNFIATPGPSGVMPVVWDLPLTGNGAVTDFAATGAASNWQALASHDSDTSYVASNVVGAKDLYTKTALPATAGTILGGCLWAVARKDDASPRQLALTMRSGATDADEAAATLLNSYVATISGFDNDPNTAAPFTKAAFDSAQVGLKVAS